MVINYKMDKGDFTKKFIGETKYEHFSEFSYRCYSICRSKVLSLYAEAYDGDELLYDAELNDYRMNVRCILIEKISKGSVVDSKELLTGIADYSATAAYNIIQRRPIDIDDIEVVLEENGIPYLRGFNDNAKTFMRIKMREAVPEKVIITRKKSFRVEFLAYDPFFESVIETAAGQTR